MIITVIIFNYSSREMGYLGFFYVEANPLRFVLRLVLVAYGWRTEVDDSSE